MTEIEKLLVRTQLFELRQAVGLPQWKVALASGVKDSRISKLEHGMPPTPLDIRRLTAFFGVPAVEIWPDLGKGDDARNS
jgi:transcriptional regulator with XRE-family HTH domain